MNSAVASLALSFLAISTAFAQAPQGMEPGPRHETNLELGSFPPATPALPAAADGVLFDLEAQRGEQPILVHFFRGTW
jgi:hypothetical protein